jgi:FkbM family methyltransferase
MQPMAESSSRPSPNRPLPLMARLARPYIYNELPGWGKVYDAFCSPRNPYPWPKRSIRGKWHGMLMELDLSEPVERFTYFLGRYYDSPTQLFLKRYLREGDNFVDIGANVGMISLLAAHLVGDNGTVRSFEPNPKCADRIEALIKANDLQNLTLRRNAVADVPGQLQLKVPEHTGMGTLADIPEEHVEVYSNRYVVDVVRGDDVLAGDTPIQIMKIDVEGYECKVLAGCGQAIRKWQPFIITEVVPEHLQRAGSSSEELFALMHSYGYKGYGLAIQRKFGRYDLSLQKLGEENGSHCEDIIWVYPGSKMSARLGAFG